ncbi:hypothetical protein GCM10023176_42820 [Micromonospora coerulea]|uniref:Uncharacterized protein n=1 Tax=Micromonospora coerulea TaxID=47856 RepID=A0ABP8SUK9_9ACTN
MTVTQPRAGFETARQSRPDIRNDGSEQAFRVSSLAEARDADKALPPTPLPLRNALVAGAASDDLPLPVVAQRHPMPGLTAQREEMRRLNASS